MDFEIFASSFMLAVVLGGPLRFKLFPQDLFQPIQSKDFSILFLNRSPL
jgi:hypothetical protein